MQEHLEVEGITRGCRRLRMRNETLQFFKPEQRRVGTAVGAHRWTKKATKFQRNKKSITLIVGKKITHPTLLPRELPGKILAAAHRRGTARRAPTTPSSPARVAVPHKTTLHPCHFDQREKSPSHLYHGDLSLRSRCPLKQLVNM